MRFTQANHGRRPHLTFWCSPCGVTVMEAEPDILEVAAL